MPQKVDKIAINNEALDRRVKLTQSDKYEIIRLYSTGDYSQRKLANLYKVSRRTIQFILDPEKLVKNREVHRARGGWRQYYNKDNHKEYMKEHRNYKKDLVNKGKLNINTTENGKTK